MLTLSLKENPHKFGRPWQKTALCSIITQSILDNLSYICTNPFQRNSQNVNMKSSNFLRKSFISEFLFSQKTIFSTVNKIQTNYLQKNYWKLIWMLNFSANRPTNISLLFSFLLKYDLCHLHVFIIKKTYKLNEWVGINLE